MPKFLKIYHTSDQPLGKKINELIDDLSMCRPDIDVEITTSFSALIKPESLPLTTWRHGKYGGYGKGEDDMEKILEGLLEGRLIEA